MELQPPRALTRAEVREVDRRAIEELGLPGVVLMENAGRGLTDAVEAILAETGAGDQVLIVVGGGNNGGDGLVLARQLHLRGHRPSVAYCGDRARVDRATDAGINLTVVERAQLELTDTPDGPALTAFLSRHAAAPLLVDALYGTGLAGELRPTGRGWVEALDADPRPVVAVDIPSGLDCDSGLPLGAAVYAVRTITFVGAKLGFTAPGAKAYTGDVQVVGIGCPPVCWDHVS